MPEPPQVPASAASPSTPDAGLRACQRRSTQVNASHRRPTALRQLSAHAQRRSLHRPLAASQTQPGPARSPTRPAGPPTARRPPLATWRQNVHPAAASAVSCVWRARPRILCAPEAREPRLLRVHVSDTGAAAALARPGSCRLAARCDPAALLQLPGWRAKLSLPASCHSTSWRVPTAHADSAGWEASENNPHAPPARCGHCRLFTSPHTPRSYIDFLIRTSAPPKGCALACGHTRLHRLLIRRPFRPAQHANSSRQRALAAAAARRELALCVRRNACDPVDRFGAVEASSTFPNRAVHWLTPQADALPPLHPGHHTQSSSSRSHRARPSMDVCPRAPIGGARASTSKSITSKRPPAFSRG